MQDKGPKLDKAVLTFVQDGNTLGSTDEFETLKLTLETQLPGEDGFFVIKTGGWSIDQFADLEELFGKIWKIKEDLVKE